MNMQEMRKEALRRKDELTEKSKIFLTRALRKAYGAVGSVQTKTHPSAYIPQAEMTDCRKKGGTCYCVGFGKTTLFPEDFMKRTYYLTGHSSGEPATGYFDEPMAHAVWLDDCSGRGGILLVSLDTIGLLHADVEKIRESLSDFAYTTACRSIHILCTGCHSGFDTLGIWGKNPLTGRDRNYMRFLYAQVKRAAVDAYRDRRDGQLYHGQTHVPDLQQDARAPQVYSDLLTRIRFVPKDGSREVWMVHFSVRTDTLRGTNTRISADFPAYLRDAVRSRCGAETVYFVGAVGGGITVPAENEENLLAYGADFYPAARETGERLAAYAMQIDREKKMPVCINLLSQPFYLDVDNTLLLTAKLTRVLCAESFFREDTSMGMAVRSEMTYLMIGRLPILLVPGVLFPELVSGGYLDAEQSATGDAAEKNPLPLCRIAGRDDLLIFGFADDHLGNVIPPNDFLLHPDTPYLAAARDRFGRKHGEEQFSLGVSTAQTIADTFAGMTDAVRRAAEKAAQ